VDRSNLTLGAYLCDHWLPGLESDLEKQLRPSTLASYRENIRLHVISHIGKAKLQALTEADLNRLYRKLITEGRRDGKGPLSGRTVRYVHVLIHGALEAAVNENLVSRNVAKRAKPPRVDRGREPKAWTSDEARSFLAVARADRLSAMWTLLITTGARRGEIVGLTWDYVDLDSGRLRIRKALVSIGYQVTESLPKTSKSRRDISLDPGTVAALKEWRKSQLEERLAWGPAYVDSGYVFTREDGQSLHPDRVSKMFNRLVTMAGVPRIPLHGARHTAATLLLEAGIPAKVVQERLGHSSIVVTMDTYSHVVERLDRTAAEALALMTGVANNR